jgi:hypothetical protein
MLHSTTCTPVGHTVEVAHAVQNDVYDPDDVGLRDSPPLRPLQLKLQPTRSPSPDESEFEDVQTVPSQGDAVLIGLLGNGKALEVARNAATNLLPAANKKREISATWQKSDHMTDLKALEDALNVGKIHTARIATSPNGPAPPPLSEDSIARRLNRLNYNIIQGSDKLAPIQSPSPKSDNANGITLPSISAKLGHLAQITNAATARADDKEPSSNYRPSSRLTVSNFQNRYDLPLETQRSPPVSPDNNSSRVPLPSVPSTASDRPPSTKPQLRDFNCTYPGCSAQPFQTQYFLKSHANVHSSNRPHYCPVKGCPRSEGGNGFKRKNEMLRHGLVHESPGYVCPFCGDEKYKYPRPDNLQRSVS